MKSSLALTAVLPAAYAATNACSAGIVGLLQPLSTYAPARSYCSSKYPQQYTTLTSTAPAVTSTVSTTISSTVISTSIEFFQPGNGNNKRDMLDEREARRKRATTTTTKATTTRAAVVDARATLFSRLVAAVSSDISVFCSCIEPTTSTTTTTTPTMTTTFTSTILTSTTTTATSTLQSYLPCSNVQSPSNPYTWCNTPNGANCGCQPQIGTGMGICYLQSYNYLGQCRSDADCTNGEHCLGYYDTRYDTTSYYCSDTEQCV